MSLPEIMGIGKVDLYCAKIVSIFLLEHKAYRFNELERKLENMKLKITAPTLKQHLRHLVEKKVLIRDELEKNFVAYSFNWKRWPNLDQLLKERIIGEKAFRKSWTSSANVQLKNRFYTFIARLCSYSSLHSETV